MSTFPMQLNKKGRTDHGKKSSTCCLLLPLTCSSFHVLGMCHERGMYQETTMLTLLRSSFHELLSGSSWSSPSYGVRYTNVYIEDPVYGKLMDTPS